MVKAENIWTRETIFETIESLKKSENGQGLIDLLQSSFNELLQRLEILRDPANSLQNEAIDAIVANISELTSFNKLTQLVKDKTGISALTQSILELNKSIIALKSFNIPEACFYGLFFMVGTIATIVLALMLVFAIVDPFTMLHLATLAMYF